MALTRYFGAGEAVVPPANRVATYAYEEVTPSPFSKRDDVSWRRTWHDGVSDVAPLLELYGEYPDDFVRNGLARGKRIR